MGVGMIYDVLTVAIPKNNYLQVHVRSMHRPNGHVSLKKDHLFVLADTIAPQCSCISMGKNEFSRSSCRLQLYDFTLGGCWQESGTLGVGDWHNQHVIIDYSALGKRYVAEDVSRVTTPILPHARVISNADN